jgi:pyruvate kinase
VFTGSGSTARRVARERPGVPMLVLTPSHKTARRLALLWGAHAVTTKDIGSFEEMIAKGKRMALRHGFGTAGSRLSRAWRAFRSAPRDRPTCSTS